MDSQKRRQQGSSSSKEQSSFDSSMEDITCGSVKEKLGKGKVDTIAIENIECQINVGNKDVQENKGANLGHIHGDCVTDSDTNVEMIEMPVRMSVESSKTGTVSTLKHKTQNQAQISKPKLRRSSRVRRKFTEHSDINESVASGLEQPHFGSNSKTSSDLGKCDSDCNIDIKNNLLRRKSAPSEEEEAICKVNDIITKCVTKPIQGNCVMDTGKSQSNRVRATRSILNICNDKTIQEGVSDFPEGKPLTEIDSKKRKLSVHTSSQRESALSTSKCKHKTFGHNTHRHNDKELTGDLRTKEGLRGKSQLLNENNLNFPDSQLTSSFSSSQARGHKLLSVDVLEPSQDLIMPVTPVNHKKFTQGPYTGLKIKGSKSQRVSQRNQKGSSSIPLPRNSSSVHIKKKVLNFSSSTEGSEAKASFDEESMLKLQLSTSSSTQNSSLKASSLEREIGSSSEDDNVFFESKILSLPRPRRSTEEFHFGNELKPKGGRKCKSKSGNHPSICLTSVHSKERSSLISIIRKLGSYEVTEHVNHNTTHVVCGEARRTLNLLFGIARGCWILDVSWLYQSLEMEAWAPEEPFELFIFCPGAKICRQQKENQGASYQQTLFSGVGSICVLDGCAPSSAQIREILQLCGAVLVSTTRNANLVIGKCTVASGAKGSIAQITHVSEKWVLDSIQQHKIQPLADYKLS